MSSESPPAPLDADTSSINLLCPSCKEPFAVPPSPCVPTSLDCGHCVCAPCFEAVSLAAPNDTAPLCPICCLKCGKGVINYGLVALLESQGPQLSNPVLSCLECDDDDSIPTPFKRSAIIYCRSCDNTRLCDLHVTTHRSRHHKLADLDHTPTRPFTCIRHAHCSYNRVCFTENCLLMCPKDSPCGTEASPHHVVSLVDLVPAELRSRALNVRSALSDRLISVQEFHERVLQARASLFANTEVTIARFHEDIAAVKAELDAKADRLVREVTVVRDERVKALDNQISELNVSMEQHRAGLELCSRVLDSEYAPDKACHFVNSAVSLGSVPVAEATVRASDCLQILFDMKSVLDRVEPSFSVRYAAVDSNRSEVNGDGMSGFLRGFENEFSIVCMDTAGQYMDTVTEKDISVELTGRLADGPPALSSTGDVADVGRVVVSPVKISDTGRVRTPWLFSVRYSVEAADIVAVVLGIRVCGVLVGDHDWLVPLCRLNRLAVHQLGSERVGDGGNPNSIAASRLLQTRMRLSNKRTCFCVSPDESVLVTIARDSETAPELSVYSLPECVLVCQFRLRFRNIFGPPDPVAPCIHQFCFSPRAGSSTNQSIMWCDDRFHSASRMSAVVREARLNLQMGSGSQIRSLPCAGAQCVDANTDVIVVGCSPSVSGSPDNPIVSGVIRVFSFAEGALMREFPVSISHMVREVPSPLLPVLLSTDGQSIYILIDPAVVSHSITGEFIRQDFCVECDYDLSEELTADVAILTGFALLEKGFLVVCQRLDLIGSHLALPDSQLNLIDLADVESGYASIGSQYLGTAHAMSSRCLVASRGPRVYVLDLHNNSVTTYTYSPPCSPPAVTVRVEASAAQSSASHADDV